MDFTTIQGSDTATPTTGAQLVEAFNGNFEKVKTISFTDLPSNPDLDTITTPGRYFYNEEILDDSLSDIGKILIVGEGFWGIYQIRIDSDGISKRINAGDGWGLWKKISFDLPDILKYPDAKIILGRNSTARDNSVTIGNDVNPVACNSLALKIGDTIVETMSVFWHYDQNVMRLNDLPLNPPFRIYGHLMEAGYLDIYLTDNGWQTISVHPDLNFEGVTGSVNASSRLDLRIFVSGLPVSVRQGYLFIEKVTY